MSFLPRSYSSYFSKSELETDDFFCKSSAIAVHQPLPHETNPQLSNNHAYVAPVEP